MGHFSTHLKPRHKKAKFRDSFIHSLKNAINTSIANINDGECDDSSDSDDDHNRSVGDLMAK